MLAQIIYLCLIAHSIYFPISTTVTVNPEARFNPTQAQTGDNLNVFVVKNQIKPNNITFPSRSLMMTISGNQYWINITSGSNAIINIWKWFQDNTVVLEYTTTGTYVTQLYVGNLGEPTVDGADSWSYNPSTKIVQFTTSPSSSQYVYVIWTGGPTPGRAFVIHGVYNETNGYFTGEVATVTAYFTDGTNPLIFTVNGTYTFSTTNALQFFRIVLPSGSVREYWLESDEYNAEFWIFDETFETYTISFLDLAGLLEENPYVSASYYINGTLYVVDKRKADIENKCEFSLYNGRKYTITLHDGSNYVFGELLVGDAHTIVLTLRGVDFPKETLLTYKYIRVYWRREFGNPNGNITLIYQDTLNETNSVEIYFNYRNGTNAYNYTETASTFIHVWASALNNTDYQGIAVIDHQRYGIVTVKQFFSREFSEAPWGLSWLGSLPFSTAIIIPAILIVFAGGCFSAINAEVGAFMATVVAAGLTLIGWIPIQPGILITAFCFCIMMGIIYAKRRVQV